MTDKPTEKPVVHFDVEDGVGVITIDYPPVNALGPGVSDGILAALDKGEADPNVKAFVMLGAGRTFIAGADIRQFGKARPNPTRRTYDALDQGKKPVVAAIHGYALGGGLENALACHYRIAVPSAKVGLPEVQIGILPGGGGTQRLPRIVGPKIALDMIVSGRHVPAEEAKALGIIDEIVPGKDLRAEAIAYAKSISAKRPLPRVRDRTEKLAEAKSDPGMFDAARKQFARRMRGQPAPEKCIQAVEAACTQPFDEGVATERRLFGELENTPEAKALRYAFFAEREIARIPTLPKDLKTPEIKTMAVVGAGTMGGGIAMCFANVVVTVLMSLLFLPRWPSGVQVFMPSYDKTLANRLLRVLPATLLFLPKPLRRQAQFSCGSQAVRWLHLPVATLLVPCRKRRSFADKPQLGLTLALHMFKAGNHAGFARWCCRAGLGFLCLWLAYFAI